VFKQKTARAFALPQDTDALAFGEGQQCIADSVNSAKMNQAFSVGRDIGANDKANGFRRCDQFADKARRRFQRGEKRLALCDEKVI
jgi:hypothetical protein